MQFHAISCTCCSFLSVFFFFQAEDGIRDLVRSRGLGDVYKRQRQAHREVADVDHLLHLARALAGDLAGLQRDQRGPVSYTHLTLPTSDLV